MRAVLIERHCLGRAAIDLCTTTFYLRVPCRTRVRVGLPIEAPEELEGQARSFFGGEPKNFFQDVSSSHGNIIAEGARSCVWPRKVDEVS